MIVQIIEKCDAFLEKKINIAGLQQDVNVLYSNLEGDVDLLIHKNVHNFIERLEYIRFLHSKDQHFEVASKEVLKLRDFLVRVC